MTEDYPIEEGTGTNLFANLPDILWQRRWLIILPTILAALAGIAAVVLLKPVYTSSATILIESQQLPQNLIDSPVADMIDERIARVRQRVLSRPDLVKIIRAQNLYPNDQASKPLSKIVQEMREDTSIDALSADVQPSGGLRAMSGHSTIAFGISFSYFDPIKAQAVAQQYVNNFLELDASSQQENAAGAASFLGEQAADIQVQIQALENKITAIKAANGPLLALQQISTGNPIADAARIDSEIASIASDSIRTSAAVGSASPDAANVQSLETALRQAEAKYSDTHPDVIALKAQLDTARAAADKSAPAAANASASLIASNNARIASLRAAKAMLLSQNAQSQNAQSRAPAVAEQVNQLEKQADTLRAQYALVGGKLMGAQVSAKMETQQKGERLSLADPPVVPEVPSKPNRPLILIGSVVAGFGLGVALVILLELLFKPIRGTRALGIAAGRPPLVVIPELAKRPGWLLRLLQSRSRRKLARSAA